MASVTNATLESIKKTIKGYFAEADLTLIDRAYSFAETAHASQMRSSGDPYIIHPTEVAQILADLRLDLASICAAFLHDTVEDTEVTIAGVRAEFGEDVAELVDGVTKLSKITFRTTEEKQAENFRKMIIAMSKDIRVILVKLADRLSNMRSLQYLAPVKQKRIAQETLDIYAPIANRLGMSKLKIELEDLCLRYLHPDVYYRLAELVQKSKAEREHFTEEVCRIIEENLREYEVIAQVSGRAKHFYSMYKKMERRQVDYHELHDLIAFRIVVDNITECYKALGVIHSVFKPIPGRFKDYIAMPKANNYQSLHTMVISPSGERVEIQIRTQEMHQVAEKGIAAHWKYKEGRFELRDHENVQWVTRLLEWQKDLSDPNEFLETVKIDLFSDDVFVFTPKGEVKQLPYGSTPLDFAYAVHTDVGHRCTGVRINDRIATLRQRLKSGDVIEVLTGPVMNPSKDWLKFVHSSRAKAKIRAFIKVQERESAKLEGRELLEKALRTRGWSLARLEKSEHLSKMLQETKGKTLEEVFISIGYGRFPLEDVLDRVFPKAELEEKRKELENESLLKRMIRTATKRSETRNAIIVEGLDDMLVRFGRCCNPVPGESIVGFITRGRGVTIHKSNCTRAIDIDSERKVDVKWSAKAPGALKRIVRLKVFSTDGTGLLASLSQTISGCGVNIASANVRTTKDRKALFQFDVEVGNMEQLDRVLSALESRPNVISVERGGS